MKLVTFYWYPKCSTCKKAKIWLDENKIAYNLINMIETPPSKEQFITWMNASDLPVRRFFNYSGSLYRQQGLKDIVNDFSVEEAAKRLSEEGMLIKRPLLITEDGQAIPSFRESTYEELLKK